MGGKAKNNILLVYLVWHWSFNRELLVLALVLSFTRREHLPCGDESLPSFFPGKG